MKISRVLILFALVIPLCVVAEKLETKTLETEKKEQTERQEKPSEQWPIHSRARVIIDNDFGGDPDGLYQLAHHLLSPAVEVRGVIASGHYEAGFYDQPGSVEFSLRQATQLIDVVQRENKINLMAGVPPGIIVKDKTALTAARFIVQEAMR